MGNISPPKPCLQAIGARIRQRRRQLGVTAVATAAAAGISRVTLHRIETGAPSVTVGALINVLDALELPLSQLEHQDSAAATTPAEPIELAAYPLLRNLAWHVQGTGSLSAAEAAAIYARHRRRLDLDNLQPQEARLIEALNSSEPGADVPA
jgi:transcriptional regulator with XRE-family HTH domain